MKIKLLVALLASSLWCGWAQAQIGDITNPLNGRITVVDAGTCSTANSFVTQQLPQNASTTTVNLSGTFTAALTARLSNNGGATWTTGGAVAAGTTSFSTNGFTHICVDATAFTSGTVLVSISTGILQVQSVVAGPSSSSSFSSGALDATSSVYAGGVKMGRTCFSSSDTITVTNGSVTVVCNNAAFTAADVGSDIFAIAGGCCGGSLERLGTLALGVTSGTQVKISTVTNATTVQVSATAVAGCTANCVLVWGPNNDAALSALDTAVQALNLCGQIQLPSGGPILFNQVHWNYTATRCMTSAQGLNYGYGVTGWGPGATWLTIEPNFNWAGCVFSSTGNSCLFTYAQAELSYFSVWGAGYGFTGTNGKILINTGIGSQLNQISLLGFSGSDGASTGISLSGGDRAWGLACDAFGRTCGINTFTGLSVPNYMYWSFFGDTIVQNFQSQSGTLIDYGGEYGGQGAGGTANLEIGGGIYYGYGSGIFNANQNATNCVGIWVKGGTAYLWGGQWDNSFQAGCDGAAVSGTAILYSEGSTFKGNATGFAVSIQNTAQFVDMGGGNQFQGVAPFQFLNTGAYVPYKSVSGACTGTVTASLTTGGIYGTGPNITSSVCNVSPNNTAPGTLGAGVVMDHAGNTYALQVTATAAGTNASSGVVTVMKNGVATTVTCTIGAGTSCSDGTHVATFVRGDIISLQYTTQAADTLAGLKVVAAAY